MESPEQGHLQYISGGDEYTDEEEIKRQEDFATEKSKASAANKNYTILTEEDIFRRQGDAMASVCSVLSVSKTAACLLLHRYNWSANVVLEKWFASEESVRKAVGLLPESTNPVIGMSRSSSSSSFDEVLCRICFENFPPESFYSAACGHRFCESCWKSYIRTAINDGAGCLTLRCPETSCGGAAAVGLDMIGLLASREDRRKYNQFLLRSYVEENRNRKWCPSPGCAFAVEYHSAGGDDDGDDYNVTCNCSHSFCWNCTEESHRPVDCETLEKWKTKNDAESNNTQWIRINTKPCPQCNRPIEKNQGCNRIACLPPCKFQFCWLCLQNWSVHGYNSCNGYKSTTEKLRIATEEEINRKHFNRYTHFYERWASNENSKKKALLDLGRMDGQLEKLSEAQSQPKLMLDFVVEAWKQIVECRRILKWSYVYGYYLSEEEEESDVNVKLPLFVYLQGQAESGLERLHHCAEQELEQFIYGECNFEKFVDFRSKLKRLTRVTGNYFENLVGALKNGLSEVDSNGDHKRLRRR
ncbi:hypothetical protein BUALT_Bualt02G0049500 [Buddleja alternifolia]|uniref:RBR-type E3 ubiquitin transferase n=1 Tax=Buddleja alternifolia TaxID=168488 RepID=A0AAV6Y1S4_9LAMI|nr:hypothetical protein BUALT_Bualt02G0049500 [Buddleja alternifolia]